MVSRFAYNHDPTKFIHYARDAIRYMPLQVGSLLDAILHAEEAAPTCASPQMSESSLAYVTKLRAKAARYRLLAEGFFDSNMVAVVQACARELESEATSIEKTEARARFFARPARTATLGKPARGVGRCRSTFSGAFSVTPETF